MITIRNYIFSKIAILIVLLFSSSIAQDLQRLEDLRSSYERENQRIKDKYILSLNELKAVYMKSDNFAAAEMVQSEIEKLQVDLNTTGWFIGEWKFSRGGRPHGVLDFKEGGELAYGKTTALWTVDQDVLTIRFPNKYVHKINLPERQVRNLTTQEYTPSGATRYKWNLQR